ncbi:hypothetical protein Plhal703r1_c81g0173901 [Plasmopara halstedii]
MRDLPAGRACQWCSQNKDLVDFTPVYDIRYDKRLMIKNDESLLQKLPMINSSVEACIQLANGTCKLSLIESALCEFTSRLTDAGTWQIPPLIEHPPIIYKAVKRDEMFH